jgi:hypothetical protein
VFINGYQSSAGYTFSSPDHLDVNDVLPSQVPLLDEIAEVLGNDGAFYDIDASLPAQFWSFSYRTFRLSESMVPGVFSACRRASRGAQPLTQPIS